MQPHNYLIDWNLSLFEGPLSAVLMVEVIQHLVKHNKTDSSTVTVTAADRIFRGRIDEYILGLGDMAKTVIDIDQYKKNIPW